jgi:sugar lactone lactonase YvrE
MPRKIKQKKIRRTRRGQKGGQQAEPSGSAVVTTLAGNGREGFIDGTATNATFNTPRDVAVDAAGNVYVADGGSNRIRKITPGGMVTTLAGSGSWVFSDGTGSGASFSQPHGVAVDAIGNVFVADTGNHRIRKVTPQGVVTTLAGSTMGFADGIGSNAKFNFPTGVDVDATGNIFVADSSNNRIRIVTPEGVVRTLAGSGAAAFADGTGAGASFNNPQNVAVDAGGNVFVADMFNHRIRRISPGGVVSTLAGDGYRNPINGLGRWQDGIGMGASFSAPCGVVVDANNNIIVGDSMNTRIRMVTPQGIVTTLAGNGSSSFADGIGAAASFGYPSGVAINASGDIFVSDLKMKRIRKITLGSVVSSITTIPSRISMLPIPPPTTTGRATTTANQTTKLPSPNVILNVGGPSWGQYTIKQSLIPSVLSFNQTFTAGDISISTINSGTWRPDIAYFLGHIVLFNGSYYINLSWPDARGQAYSGSYGASPSTDLNAWMLIKLATTTGRATSLQTATPLPTTTARANITAVGISAVPQIAIPPQKSTELQSAVKTLAGGTRGTANGIGTAAQFNEPWGIAQDSLGNTYVAEYGNHCIRKIDPSRNVTTFAGIPKSSGAQNGIGTAARFNQPQCIIVDRNNNLYVADSANNMIRMITSSGVVSTIAGSTTSGSTNGLGITAKFNRPYGIAMDAAGNIYVADTNNHIIRKIDTATNVTTFAGSGSIGKGDGIGIAAQFYNPYALAIDNTTNMLYVADWGNGSIRAIKLANASVSTLAGNGSQGFKDGIGRAAQLRPANIVLGPSNMLYVADANNNRIRAVNIVTGEVTTIAGNGVAGNADSTTILNATFNNPRGIGIGNNTIYVTHFSGDYSVRTITGLLGPELAMTAGPQITTGPTTTGVSMIRGGIITLAGGTKGYSAGTAAKLNEPWGIVTDTIGNVYVADNANHCICKMDSNGNLTIFAGTTRSQGLADGVGPSAKFWNPRSLTIDSKNNLYVADNGNHAIRKIEPTGNVTTIAGGKGAGYADGKGPAAKFFSPHGIFIDNTNNIYVADTGNHRIRKIDPSLNVTTFAGSSVRGSKDGPGMSASFNSPYALTIDSANNIMYVADWDSARVRKITMLPTPIVTTLAGNGNKAYKDGIGAAASLQPANLTLGSNNILYVADANNNRLRAINTTTGNVITIAGNGTAGNLDNVDLLKASFNNPRGIWIDKNNIIYVTQYSPNDSSIRMINMPSMPFRGGGKRKRRSMRKTRRRGRRS